MKGLTKEVTTVGRRKSKDIHRRLVEEFREADRKYGEDYGEVPDFDFSFLDDPDSGTVDREQAIHGGCCLRHYTAAVSQSAAHND